MLYLEVVLTWFSVELVDEVEAIEWLLKAILSYGNVYYAVQDGSSS